MSTEAILAALPGTMQELSDRTGLKGQALWDAVHTMRRAGVIHRAGPRDHRQFMLVGQKLRAPDAPPLSAEEEKAEEKKARKRAVVLFWIPGWPNQDPNRRMLWKICWSGMPEAERAIKLLAKRCASDDVDVRWETARMTKAEAKRLKEKGFTLAEQRERERLMRAADAASAADVTVGA